MSGQIYSQRPDPTRTFFMITSTQNPKIKWVRLIQSQSRARREEQSFAVEGVRLVEEAAASGWPARLVLHTEDLSPRGRQAVERLAAAGAEVEMVSENVLRSASDTQNPQDILAVLEMQTLPLPPRPDFLFIPDQVRDPGNLGTMLRTAAAAGAHGVLLTPGSVDPYSPKVLRSAMGAHFRLPIHALSWEEIRSLVQAAGLQVYLAAAGEGQSCYASDFRAPLALIVGGEAYGASEQARLLTTTPVHIPMPGGMESLNAAIAAAILLFEVVRQRQETPS